MGRDARYIVAEIGINHNGDLGLAKKLIDVATTAGCDAVKFQKRAPEVSVPERERETPRETPWGMMTYLEYRKKLEFGEAEYREIDINVAQLEICHVRCVTTFCLAPAALCSEPVSDAPAESPKQNRGDARADDRGHQNNGPI